MTIEKQVCSLELAKRLKELGVKQDSLFYWYYVKNLKSWEIFSIHEDVLRDKNDVSAFTVAELGERLPRQVKEFYLSIGKHSNGQWLVQYVTILDVPKLEQQADTEADARAKMFVYLLENKLITL